MNRKIFCYLRDESGLNHTGYSLVEVKGTGVKL